MVEQHITQNVVGAIHFEVDLVDSTIGGVRKSAVDDMSDLGGCCAGHEDRVEANAVGRVGRDDGCYRFTVIVEPEQLREIVSRSRCPP